MYFNLNGDHLKIGIDSNYDNEMYPRVLDNNIHDTDVEVYYDTNSKHIVLKDKNNNKWFFKVVYSACGPAGPYNYVVLDENTGTQFIQQCDGKYQYYNDNNNELLTLVKCSHYNILYLGKSSIDNQ